MFAWLNKQGARSSDGFILQRVHRFYYVYEEADRKMQIFVDLGAKRECISIKSFDKWMPPHDNISLTEEEKEVIKKNVSDALNFMKISFIFTKD